jgi:hypothetical protein
MLSPTLSTERITHTSHELLQNVPAHILQRGFTYFERGYVRNVTVHEDLHLKSTVMGSDTYRVVIDLNHFKNSSCTCPYGSYCKHMAATVFEMYANYGDPMDLLQGNVGWINPISSLNTPPLQESDSPQEWVAYFEWAFETYQPSHRSQLFPLIETTVQAMIKASIHWNAGIRSIFLLHTVLFCLSKLEHHLQQNRYVNHGERERTYHFLLDNLYHTLQKHTLSPARDNTHLKNIKSALFDLTFASEYSVLDWLFIYRSIWWNLFNDSAWIEEERTRLQALYNDNPKIQPLRNTTMFALAHLDIMQHRDQHAWELLQPILQDEVQELLLYLPIFEKYEQGDRLLDWLRRLQPYMGALDRRDLHFVLQFWDKLSTRLPLEGEWMEVMKTCLPYSRPFYNEFLLKTRRYRQWIDMQLSQGHGPSYIPKEYRKIIESEDMPSLLPVYHRAVEECIRQKNRASYKEAVRYLKKLRSYYRKLKQIGRFTIYIERLAEEYSRLRALQEELRKGKLIP